MATIVVIAQGVMIVTSLIAMKVASKRNYWPVILVSFMFLPIRGVLAFFLTGWWGVVPVQVLDGIGTGLQTVAVPGMIARSLNGPCRINLGQGAFITVQGVGASPYPGLVGLKAAADRMVGAASAPRRGRVGLAGSRRCVARSSQLRWRSWRMVACARQQHVPGTDILPWRRLLLWFDPKSPPDGDGSRPRSAHAHAGYRLPTCA